MTSIMLQVRVVGWWRSSVPTQLGGRSRRAPSDDHQHEADLERRRDDRGEEHQPRDDLATVAPELLGASEHGGGGLAPDGREPEHGRGVRDHVEHRGRERQRERAVARVVAATPELEVAARTARGRSRLEVREPLQQVAVRAGERARRRRPARCTRRYRTPAPPAVASSGGRLATRGLPAHAPNPTRGLSYRRATIAADDLLPASSVGSRPRAGTSSIDLRRRPGGSFRHALGGRPVQRRKARVKALASA